MIAMLGMYDMPAIQGANDRYWQAIRARLGHGPDTLTRDTDYWEIWQSPEMLLGQTCGLPYRARLHGNVNRIGTPDYALPGCPPGYYCSQIVVRADAEGESPSDFAGRTFAYNEAMSQSGWAGPIAYLNGLDIRFANHVATGAHVNSAHAIAEGRADIAGIDALTWALLSEHNPVCEKLRVIATTPPTPGLPYITARRNDPAPLAAAIRAAMEDLAPADRAALHLHGLVDIPDDAYLAVPTPPVPAETPPD